MQDSLQRTFANFILLVRCTRQYPAKDLCKDLLQLARLSNVAIYNDGCVYGTFVVLSLGFRIIGENYLRRSSVRVFCEIRCLQPEMAPG